MILNTKKKAKATASTNTGSTSRKRRASTSSADGRPTTRRRTDQSSNHCDDDQNSETEAGEGILGLEEDNNNEAAETYSDAESFFDALRADFKSGKAVDFHGCYTLAVDPLVSPKEHVQMVATEIWQISGYQWIRFWCGQDEARKKKSKASQNPDIRNRDNVGMKRFLCGSKLAVSCRASDDNNDEELVVTVQLKHAGKHVNYTDVSMPAGALDIVRENMQWLTPVAMVSKVQAAFPAITAAQIHRAWMEMSELPSMKMLLEELTDDVNIFAPEAVPEGKIAAPLKGKIVEIGVHMTCK
ncbi:hypothetical protein B0H10DRAFT_2094601 [Mycena sp. CBHHK59/15]|nr:hypothetical protein B0H10DRAFT_2094601 [Mycena sp. CBHHK59/15]